MHDISTFLQGKHTSALFAKYSCFNSSVQRSIGNGLELMTLQCAENPALITACIHKSN